MPEPLNITRLEEILTSLGFHRAKEYVSFPIVPGADGADTFWTRGLRPTPSKLEHRRNRAAARMHPKIRQPI